MPGSRDRYLAHEVTLNDCVGTCASRSGVSLLFLLRGLASSPEFDLANTAFLFPGSRISSHRTSPAELASPCVGEASLQANGQAASIGERPVFLRRLVFRRRKRVVPTSAVLPNRCHSISDRGFRSLVVPSTSPQCTWFGKVRECSQALYETRPRKVPSVPAVF